MWGLDLRERRAWRSGGGERFDKIGLGDNGQDVGDVEFKGVGGGEHQYTLISILMLTSPS